MTRSVKCEMINDQGESASLPMHICEQYGVVKPPTNGNCDFDSPCVGKCYTGYYYAAVPYNVSRMLGGGSGTEVQIVWYTFIS